MDSDLFEVKHLFSGSKITEQDLGLLLTFYQSLIQPNFDQNELDPYIEWVTMLQSNRGGIKLQPSAEDPYSNELKAYAWGIEFHVFLIIHKPTQLPVSGLCLELFLRSNTALITYLVTAVEFRQHKLAKHLLLLVNNYLVERPIPQLDPFSLIKPTPIQVLLEAHRPETQDNVMPSWLRLFVYEHLGLRPIDFDYVAPALSIDQAPVFGFYLLALVSPDVGDISSEAIKNFIIEYYASTYTSDVDIGCFQSMMAACQRTDNFKILKKSDIPQLQME